MAATALLRFTQGTIVGGAGEALIGVVGTPVQVTNVNNLDVRSWQLDLVYVDPRSGVVATEAFAYSNNSSAPSATFTPDARGSYRWVLRLWESVGRVGEPDSIDIRVFSVRERNGSIIPPSQVWPPPLPDSRSTDEAGKPNEMNFAGQLLGWAGSGSDGLLNHTLRQMDSTLSPGTRVLYVEGASAVRALDGAADGSVHRPFARVQAALSRISASGPVNAWVVAIAPGTYIEDGLALNSPAGATSLSVVLLGASPAGTSVSNVLTVRGGSSLSNLDIRIAGISGLGVTVTKGTSLNAVIRYDRASAGAIDLSACASGSVYVSDGAVLGAVTSSRLELRSTTVHGVELTVPAIVAVDTDMQSGTRAESTAQGSLLSVDNHTLLSMMDSHVNVTDAYHLRNVHGGDFSLSYQVTTSTTTADQVLASLYAGWFPYGTYQRLSAEVIACTESDTYCGYSRLMCMGTSSGLYISADTVLVGAANPHAVRFAFANGGLLQLLCTPCIANTVHWHVRLDIGVVDGS